MYTDILTETLIEFMNLCKPRERIKYFFLITDFFTFVSFISKCFSHSKNSCYSVISNNTILKVYHEIRYRLPICLRNQTLILISYFPVIMKELTDVFSFLLYALNVLLLPLHNLTLSKVSKLSPSGRLKMLFTFPIQVNIFKLS
jgi:hypothetical protein